jgi:hypothetical protein
MAGVLDEGGPDIFDPAAWSQAAEFIVRVHKELPEELAADAVRSRNVAQHLFSQAMESAQGLVSGMCCPPREGRVIEDTDAHGEGEGALPSGPQA